MSQVGWWQSLIEWFRPARRNTATPIGSARATATPRGTVTRPQSPPKSTPPKTPHAAPAAPAHAQAATAPHAVPRVPDTATLREFRPPFVSWLFKGTAGAVPPAAGEQGGGVAAAPSQTASPDPSTPDAKAAACLQALDKVIASDAALSQLLPRASFVVPQLMKTLRDESYSSADVAQKISHDAGLTAEVIRMASSALQRTDAGTPDLAQAVMKIGTAGLQRAISRVVLRPLFDVRGDTLSAHAAPRVWADGEHKARLCSALATSRGVDALDAYLAGLLHNTGWSAALRALDGLPGVRVHAGTFGSPDAADALCRRRDQLFAKLLAQWRLSTALTALAHELAGAELASASAPLAGLLRDAEALTTLHALQDIGVVPGGVVAPLELPPSVRRAYAALAVD
jgi:HD-like signal output (HDOD) protein